MKPIVFIDIEVDVTTKKVSDYGAVANDGPQLHTASGRKFAEFVSSAEYICGHNIIAHDLKFVGNLIDQNGKPVPIDTLFLSPLMFPRKPYHKLLKDDKLQSDELNNPLNDSIKAMNLFYDEVNAFEALSPGMKRIYCLLLYPYPEFQGFFKYLDFRPFAITESTVKAELYGKLCENCNIAALIKSSPIELAYSLALISADDQFSLTPPWVLKNYPKTENIIKILRGTPCAERCPYCRSKLDVRQGLKRIFGFDSFRTYDGEPLQEKAAAAAVAGKSLLAVFPTGGGKSITFQLPALMAGETEHGLTVVISPLQSLMKDQVDNLEKLGIIDAVTINGMLSPIERAEALNRVENGMASLLYIAPEQLRSVTIERLLLARNVSRFVIDEAHCFSAWGQDFRVDYLYIGEFLDTLRQKKGLSNSIPVSCFTATAKPKVISDIRDYFKRTLNLELELYTTSATRENLRYAVLYKETEEEKYNTLRSLIEQKKCPTIVYVSRTRRTHELASKLTGDGFPAMPFNGKMDPADKIANQEAFINNEMQVIVATSAFGMGVDKKDVRLVIHYDISDSLENYVQEAGRAGRDAALEAECYILFNDKDLDKHFMLLNQTKLSISEIQQVWKSVKDLSKTRQKICCSALEIARQAGWDDSLYEVETRVKTAVAALENAGYIKRGRNIPRVFASSILAGSMAEAADAIDRSQLFNPSQKQNAKRIIKSLLSSRSIASAGNDEAESRVDYIADYLGLDKADVIEAIGLMREAGLLADMMDMSAYIARANSQNKSALTLNRFLQLERFLLSQLSDEHCVFNYKELNEQALNEGISFSTVQRIRTVIYYWRIKGYILVGEQYDDRKIEIVPAMKVDKLKAKFERRADICGFVLEELYSKCEDHKDIDSDSIPVDFSLLGLYKAYRDRPNLTSFGSDANTSDMEDSLLYLSKIGAMTLEGGFLVTYQGMELVRLITDNRIKYKYEDYRLLDDFYKQRIQQIHIVGEYANLMVKNYDKALQFIKDYFQIDFKKFIAKYFEGVRAAEITRNITPEKYHQLFGELSNIQREIIDNKLSKYIVVAAGPGSGKTRVLVHKLAALLLMEDVKHEQLLMVTFSRSAATEFKKRLVGLIGNAAAFVDIKTFHSYCFDLLGKIGSLEGVNDVVKDATRMINDGEVEIGRITKTVVVIDEAQDMDRNEFALIEALMRRNDNMRIIAVGDDDQNIYEFRGSDSKYMKSFITEYGAYKYEMTENYRSGKNIVALANTFAGKIRDRMKSLPGQAARDNDGLIQLIHHGGKNLEEPVVNHLLSTYRGGSACVLTTTNDEALRVMSLLIKSGQRTKLIQSNDGFQLHTLTELRFFTKIIDEGRKSPVISDALWSRAKERLFSAYRDSTCLPICRNLIADFEAINQTKYWTDLVEFVKESQMEDFYGDDKETILVSTIHKAKGREFDSVYMLLNGATASTDEERRKLYVGLTRAKNNLYIHYNNDIFRNFQLSGVERIEDATVYPEPTEVILPLTHKGVVLNYFKGREGSSSMLRCGQELCVSGDFLAAEMGGRTINIVKLSKAAAEQLRLLAEKGYRPYKAVVRFVVAWKGEDDQEETLVVLPDVYLKKQGSCT